MPGNYVYVGIYVVIGNCERTIQTLFLYILTPFHPPSLRQLDAGNVLGFFIFIFISTWLTPHNRLNARKSLREANPADNMRTNVISDFHFRGPQSSAIEDDTEVCVAWYLIGAGC